MERETGVEPASREATAWKAANPPWITSRNVVEAPRFELGNSFLSGTR
jgi:hypothetical protein